MKLDIMKKYVKKMVVGLLASALLLSGISCFSEDCGSAQAAQATGFHTETMEVSTYVSSSGERVAPKPKDSGYKNWIFAGWFEDATCKVAFKGNSGNKTAKFVPAEVLSVRCQVKSGTKADSAEGSSMRLVSSVDGLMYSEVGFDIRLGNTTVNFPQQKVCKNIYATENTEAYEYLPSDFHDMAEYYITATITNISQARFGSGFYIRPYWKTLDGTKVYGVDRYARVEDSYLKIVNVPVRLYSDEDVAAGYLEVGYDTETFTYYPNADESYDTGILFSEATAAADVADKVVRCVANVEGKEDVKAEGMYLNLRFKLNDGKTIPETTIFTIASNKVEFTDIEENDISISVGDVEIKQIKKRAE